MEKIRECQHKYCTKDISNKRKDAKFCSRDCKTKNRLIKVYWRKKGEELI